ncbi:MAG TPA: hypothetical protein VFO64_08255, partial [Gaiellaceae bacterium]|nr:hypothetical protein [Gaiellaceae bacterium]
GGLRPAFEILLGRLSLFEQAPNRLELIGAMEVRRTGDRDLALSRSGLARTTGSAWIGFAELRKSVSSAGSPAASSMRPFHTATA